MKRSIVAVLLLGVFAGFTDLQASVQVAPAPPTAAYVRICRDRRGVLDRRACRPNDPHRTQLALGSPSNKPIERIGAIEGT